MKTMQNLTWNVQGVIESAEATLKSFTEKLAKDPSYELSWGGDAFRAAARLKVFKSVQTYLNDQDKLAADEVKIENVRKEAYNNVIRGAKHPARSTSPCSNLMEQEVTVAWSDVLEMFSPR